MLMLTRTETKPHGHRTPREDDYGCGCVAEFSRLRYFHGQPLSALDLASPPAFLKVPSLPEPSLKWGTW